MADRQAFQTNALMSGATDAEFPSWDDIRTGFDDWLASEAVPETPQLRLLREIGVA